MAYIQPVAATLKLRYPEFGAVPDATVEYWLDDARAIVTDSWIEADRAPAEMELAAHNMAGNGLSSTGGAAAQLAAKGVTEFKSGAMSASFDAETVRAVSAGGYGSTRYGVDFRVRLRRNRGGPFTVGACA